MPLPYNTQAKISTSTPNWIQALPTLAWAELLLGSLFPPPLLPSSLPLSLSPPLPLFPPPLPLSPLSLSSSLSFSSLSSHLSLGGGGGGRGGEGEKGRGGGEGERGRGGEGERGRGEGERTLKENKKPKPLGAERCGWCSSGCARRRGRRPGTSRRGAGGMGALGLRVTV